MAARIADELGKVTGLDDQIVTAIEDAISAYRNRDFFFTKKRSQLVISTVANQRDYDVDDDVNIPLIQKIDFVKLTVNSAIIYHIKQISQSQMEELMIADSAANIPTLFSYYDSTLWFHPKPAAVYSIRVAGVFGITAPAAGTTEGNPWMLVGERLIRSRAKWELAMHVLEDEPLATRMKPAVDEALQQLIDESNLKGRVGKNRVVAMEF